MNFKDVNFAMRRDRFLIVLALLVSFISGLAWPRAQAGSSQELGRLLRTLQQIRMQHPQTDELQLMRAATAGLVASLKDPYSSYLSPEDYSALKSEKSGQLIGVGLELAYRDGQVLVMSVLDQTPAAAAGLRPGDQLLAIDGKSLAGLSWHDILRLMQGGIGQGLTLNYRPADGGPPRSAVLIRTLLTLSALGFSALPSEVCQLRVRTFFNEFLHQQVQEQLLTNMTQCSAGLIVDLRNNPGGLLTEAIQVAGQLGVEGVVVQILGRDGQLQTESTQTESLLPDTLPMVVLIDQGTASAAEVLAAALQESGRALVLGETSFGKGLVQSLLPLEDGSGLSLTTHRYLTRRGQNLHEAGITPDLRLPMSDPERVLKQAEAYLLSGGL